MGYFFGNIINISKDYGEKDKIMADFLVDMYIYNLTFKIDSLNQKKFFDSMNQF